MDIKDALNELAQQIKDEIIRRMHSDVGKNRKGVNTLVGSNLERSVEVKVESENELIFEIADYWQYVVTGWKFNNFKSGKVGLFNALVQWALNKVTSNNEEAYRLAGTLWYQMIIGINNVHRTIPARPFINYGESADEVLPFLEKFFEKWAEDVFEKLMDEIKYFK